MYIVSSWSSKKERPGKRLTRQSLPNGLLKVTTLRRIITVSNTLHILQCRTRRRVGEASAITISRSFLPTPRADLPATWTKDLIQVQRPVISHLLVRCSSRALRSERMLRNGRAGLLFDAPVISMPEIKMTIHLRSVVAAAMVPVMPLSCEVYRAASDWSGRVDDDAG